MTQINRRTLLKAAFISGWASAALLAANVCAAKDTSLPTPPSLRDTAHEANVRGGPLVLMASLPGCPFCELVRRNYLLPLRAEGLSAWQFDVNDSHPRIVDFEGQRVSGQMLAARWELRVTPTVLLLDSNGTEIAQRLEGIAVPDFYGAYLDDALAAARLHLKNPH